MPDLLATMELNLLEQKADALIQRIFNSENEAERMFLAQEFARITSEIAKLFQMIYNPCLD